MENKILLDTHVRIWDIGDPVRISKKALKCLEENQQVNNLYISSITFLEIAMLVSKKKIAIPIALEKFFELALRKRNIQVLPIDANTAGRFLSIDDSINKDPADRMIVATAMYYHATLVTADRNLLSSKIIKTLW